MSIDNSCTFTNGIIYFTNTGAINFGSSAVSSESSSSSFVNGKIAKTGTNAFVFPIGDVSGSNAVWAPIGIAAPVSLSTISAEYSLSAGPNNWSPSAMCSGSEIIYTSGFENWVLNTTDAHPAVTLYWKTTGSGIQDPADLVVAHYNGTCWENMGGTAVGNSTSGFITSSVEFTSYSPLSFGTKTKDNTLPVELVEFTGNCYNNKIQLSWTTASEINNNYFAIERSDNTADWTEIGLVKGVGNSNQMENYNFIDLNSGNFSHYYRLRQVNFDGKFEYSDIIMVNNCDELSNEFINVFPNPSDGNITINSNSEILEIRLCDLTGKVIYRKNKIDAVSAECNFSKLKKGMYIIEISTITKTYNQRITIM